MGMESGMVDWHIEKTNKMPIYLQLVDLVKYYISIDLLKNHQKLPGVNQLAGKVKINFDTVRKAYKELEKEGLVEVRRGTGTFITMSPTSDFSKQMKFHSGKNPREELKFRIRELIKHGMKPAEIRALIEETVSEFSSDQADSYLIFCECDQHQADHFAAIVAAGLDISVKPVLLDELASEIDRIPVHSNELLGIVSTGFLQNEIRDLIRGRLIDLHIVITNISLETRQKIAGYKPGTSFGFICRDRESIPFYTQAIKSELGADFSLTASDLENQFNVKRVMDTSGVLLVTSPVYSEVVRTAPANVPVFNIFDRVDPVSLNILKENLSQKSSGLCE
jgi:DNA-binding transcriptional regulator YhcF (GntR family)